MNTRKNPKLDKELQTTFMEDLEESLLKSDKKACGLDQFQAIYNKKKILGQALEQEKQLQGETKENLAKIKQRVYQIQQLNQRVNKQASLMKNQYEKITEAHQMSKILMMEKIVKLQRQTEDLQRKKQQYYKIRAQKQRSSLFNKSHLIKKIERNRQNSFSMSKALKEELDQKNYNTLEVRRQRADSIKAEKERRKQKARKIQEFKQDRAKKNYLTKIIDLKNTLDNRGDQLRELYEQELTQQKHAQATKNVTTQFLSSFFPTQTI